MADEIKKIIVEAVYPGAMGFVVKTNIGNGAVFGQYQGEEDDPKNGQLMVMMRFKDEREDVRNYVENVLGYKGGGEGENKWRPKMGLIYLTKEQIEVSLEETKKRPPQTDKRTRRRRQK